MYVDTHIMMVLQFNASGQSAVSAAKGMHGH